MDSSLKFILMSLLSPLVTYVFTLSVLKLMPSYKRVTFTKTLLPIQQQLQIILILTSVSVMYMIGSSMVLVAITLLAGLSVYVMIDPVLKLALKRASH